jgi:mannose-6-phosphate isomerase-like protein (cupin superfamily)
MPRIADKPIRRIVTIDADDGTSFAWHDGPADVVDDPARPGFANVRLWATAETPARSLTIDEASRLGATLAAPRGGSAFRILVVPPDADWSASIDDDAVRAYFERAGSRDAWAGGPDARHPYMQRTATLDLCVILEGEVVLVLDTEDVRLAAGDSVVQRGTRHAWSNRTSKPCVIAVSSHDAEALAVHARH